MRLSRILTLLAVFAAHSLKSQTAGIPTVGLIGGWTFSGNANDVIGSNHATITAAGLTTDRCGNANSAYSFNGTSSYIRTSQLGPTGSSSRSLSFWARTSHTVAGGSSNARVAFDYGLNSGAGDTWQVVWNYCSGGVGLDLSNQAFIKSNSCLLDGQWHHIAIVFNSTISTVYTSAQFYLDGTLLNGFTCNVSGTNAAVNTGTTHPITFGRGVTAVRYFLGDLDDFFLYNRPLTQTEVLQLYNAMPCPRPVTGNSVVCIGSTNVYSVSPVPNGSYTWTIPTGWTGTSTTNIITVTAGTSPGTISVAVSNTCFTYPVASKTLNLISSNIVTVTPSGTTLCGSMPVTLTASGANTYTWNTSQTGSVVVVTPTANATYSVVGSSGTLCPGIASSTVTVLPVPQLNVSFNPPLCNGDTVNLVASGAGSYTWSPGVVQGTLLSVTPTASAVYTLQGTGSTGCIGTTVISVPVPPPLTLSVLQNSAGVCIGNTISFTATSSGGSGPHNYTWNPSGNTGNTHNYSEPVSGNYVYTVTVGDTAGCRLTQTVAATFFTGATITVSSHSICPNHTVNASAAGGVSYYWQPFGTTGSTQIITASGPQSYTVTGFTANNCSASATGSVYIKPAPTLSFNTFSITCGGLGSATVAASGGTGPFTYSWIPTNLSGSVVTNAMYPGTHTVEVSDSGTGCVFFLTNYFAPLVPMTGTVSATDSVRCFGANTASAAIFLAGGSGSQNYQWMSSNGTQTVAAPVTLPAGTHTVSVTDAVTFCNVTHTFTVHQPPQLSIVLTSDSDTACVGDSVTLSAGLSGGTPSYVFSWQSGPVSLQQNITENSPGLYSYIFNAADSYNCPGSDTIHVFFNAYPSLNVSSPTLCPFEPGQVTASGASTYSWSSGATTSVISVSIPSTAHFTVLGTANGCTSRNIATVNIKSAPYPQLKADSLLCIGDSLKLSAAPNFTYVWVGPQLTSSIQSPFIAPATLSNSGAYHLTVTAANGCTASATTAITVNPLPQVLYGTSTLCVGQTIVLWTSYVANGIYLWTGPGAFTSTLQTASIPNIDVLDAGSYSVAVTNSLTGCSNTGQSIISVQSPTAINFSQNSPVCAGDTLFLSAAPQQTVLWTGPGLMNNQLNVTLPGFNQPGNYTLLATQGPCIADTVFAIAVHPVTQVYVNPSAGITACEFSSVSFSATAVPQASMIIWSIPGGDVSASQISFTNLAPAQTGWYTAHANDLNGCSGADSLYLNVILAPDAAAFGDTVCLQETGSIHASGGSSFLWSGPNGFVSTSAVLLFSAVQQSNTGVYFVTVSDSSGCSDTTSAILTGIDYPLPQPAVSQYPLKACVNNSVTLSASGGVRFLWQGPSGFSAAGPQITFVPHDFSGQGVYTLSATNESNCSSSSTVYLTLYPQPVANFSLEKEEGCAPLCTQLRTTGIPGGFDNYSVWINNEEIGTAEKICGPRPGEYSITIHYADTNLCSNSETLELRVFEKPRADFLYNPEKPVAGLETVQFYDISGCRDCMNYWHFSDLVDTSGIQNPVYSYNEPGIYPVVLHIVSNNNCSDTVIKLIEVEPEFGIYVPDAFTPDGDGLNDVFAAKGAGISHFRMEVFDRWGELVFISISPEVGWDGTFRGKKCKPDIYNWRIVASTGIKQHVLTGHINLLR